jgi:multidrug resistance efflux pump
MTRLETLYNRYERLVAKGYIHSEKADRYLVILYAIKDEITKVQAENRRKNSDFSELLKSTTGLNGSQILMLLSNSTNRQ